MGEGDVAVAGFEFEAGRLVVGRELLVDAQGFDAQLLVPASDEGSQDWLYW